MAKRLFVGNLPWSVTSEELGTMFAPYGTVEFAEIKYKDLERRFSRGIGFVQMSTDEEAEAAIQGLNETDVNGRNIVVNIAQPRAPREEGSRGGFQRRDGGEWRGGGHDRGNDRGSRRDYQPQTPNLHTEEGGVMEDTQKGMSDDNSADEEMAA